jgi:3-hydroxybutyryl-CoA dehydrogenase
MSEIEANTAVVIGTGMMGPGIALTLALGGIRTTILSRTHEAAAQGVERARALAQVLAGAALTGTEQAAQAVERISGSAAFDETVAAAGLVVESGPERMEWKQELFARMDRLTSPGALLASNTSGLSITAIASRCEHPDRVATTHFWNPPHLMPLVEIVKGERTSDATAERLRVLLKACGKTPVVVRMDRPGQLGNRLQMALVREAANIIAEGIADAEAVDTVVKNGFGLRMPAYGILEHMDIAGTDLGLSVLEYVLPDLYNEPRAPEYFRSLVRDGKLGARSGQGFYDWSVKSADEVRASRDRFVIEVLRWRKAAASLLTE